MHSTDSGTVAAASPVRVQEHRTHIDVLDSALSNAQTNVLRLEEVKREMTKKLEQLQVERQATTRF